MRLFKNYHLKRQNHITPNLCWTKYNCQCVHCEETHTYCVSQHFVLFVGSLQVVGYGP